MIRCIIFDCDGTLVASEYLCNLGLEIKLRDLGIKESAPEMMIKYRGDKLARIIESLEQKHRVILGEDFVLSYRALVGKLFEKELQPIEGIVKVLEQIKQPICVASSGPRKKVEQALAVTNLKHFFGDNIFSSYEFGSWKPDPGLFLHAAGKMGFEPYQCAVVEDSPLGIKAAIAAKMYPIFYNPLNSYELFGGVRTIKHMCELSSAIT